MKNLSPKSYGVVVSVVLFQLLAAPLFFQGGHGAAAANRTLPPHKVKKIVASRLPDLTVTRIYHRPIGHEECIMAEIKNQGGPISREGMSQANVHFFLHYLNRKFPGPRDVRNGYSFRALSGLNALLQPGGSMTITAPIKNACQGDVQVTVQVDLPINSGGLIRESNEKNNQKVVTLRCP